MKKISNSIIAFSLILSCVQAKCQEIDEYKIYNSLMDSLYNLRYCIPIIDSPFFRCCDADYLNSQEFAECCEKSNTPKKYRVSCQLCINRKELDTLKKIMILQDTFLTLNISQERKDLLYLLKKDQPYYYFIKHLLTPIKSRKLDPDSIQQGTIKFISLAKFKENGYNFRQGVYKERIYLGDLQFSRIYIDDKKGFGIFYISWTGTPTCGYSRYFLIKRENGNWKIHKKIEWGAY